MAVSMYQISLPIFVRQLNGLAGCMKKHRRCTPKRSTDESSLLSYRFYPDMFSFAKQVQIATDHARKLRRAACWTGGLRSMKTTKRARPAHCAGGETIAYLKTIKPEQIDGTEGKASP